MPEVAPEFLASARAFRAALVAEDVEDGAFARHMRNAVARVFLAAALLGPPTTVEGDDPPARRPRSSDSGALRHRLQARFGANDVFVEVYDPSRLVEEDVKPFERLLSAELVEIDEDIAEAIEWLEESHPDALWDVRWAFENHWGQHALACLRPLHPRHLRRRLTQLAESVAWASVRESPPDDRLSRGTRQSGRGVSVKVNWWEDDHDRGRSASVRARRPGARTRLRIA